jgi:hypothetical protein
MRVRGLAFVGLCVGAFLIPSSTATAASSLSSSPLTTNTQNLDRFFSSDGPDSLHESINQGTVDEPRLWPQSNKWLHATLSEAEREFLSLAVTGSVPSGYNANTVVPSNQQSDNQASFTVYLRFNFNVNNVPTINGQSFQNQLQQDLTNCVSGAISNAVTGVTLNSNPPGYPQVNNEIYVQFTLRSIQNGQTAGQLLTTLANQYSSSGSQCRNTGTFQYIDLSFNPYFIYNTNQGQVSNGNVTPSTAAPSSNACSSNPCINGGTCQNQYNANTQLNYTCQCGTNYIGAQCQYNLNGSSRKNRLAASSSSVSRGKSVARPNLLAKPSA